MARKKQANASTSSAKDASPLRNIPPSSLSKDIVADGAPVAPRIDILAASAGMEEDAVKVNNMNVTELKIACDDAVRRVSWSSLLRCVVGRETLMLHYP